MGQVLFLVDCVAADEGKTVIWVLKEKSEHDQLPASAVLITDMLLLSVCGWSSSAIESWYEGVGVVQTASPCLFV